MNRDLLIVDDAHSAERFAEQFLPGIETDPIAFDVEEDRMVHYTPRIALMQVTIGDNDILVDPLALDRDILHPIVEALCLQPASVLMHGAQNDITGLKRDFGVAPDALRDTQLAARFAGSRTFGLAGLLDEHFGVTLEKATRTSDWTKRPLTDKQVDYARRDTVWLAELWQRLEDAVRERGFEDALDEENRALASLPPGDPTFDPDGWRSIRGLRKKGQLSDREKSRIAALWQLRDDISRREDLHPTRTLPPWLMVELGRRGSSMLDSRRPNRALTTFLDLAGADELTEALDRPPPLPDTNGRSSGRSKPPWQRHEGFDRRMDKLLAWRERTSEETGLESGFLAPRTLIEAIANLEVPDRDAIASIPDIRQWRVDRWADEWLGML